MSDQFLLSEFDSIASENPLADSDILDIIGTMIEPNLLSALNIKLKENKGSYNSIVAQPIPSPWNNIKKNTLYLLARLKVTNGTGYISFNSKYEYLFKYHGIPYYKSKSDDYIRLEIGVFILGENRINLSKIIQIIIPDLFNVETFGCCNNYLECSNAMHCIYFDLIFATACQYKKNLDAGKIFYGKNCNI